MEKAYGCGIVVGRPRRSIKSGWLWHSAEKHLWCAFCSRIFHNGIYRLLDGNKTCPYADCDADIARDARAWSAIRSRHPNYPAAPWLGIQYPLHAPAGPGESMASPHREDGVNGFLPP